MVPKTLYSSPRGWYVGEAEGDIALRHCFCCRSQEATQQNCYSQLIWASGQIGGNAQISFLTPSAYLPFFCLWDRPCRNRESRHNALSWQELGTLMLAHLVPVYTHTDAHTWSPEPHLRVLNSYLTSEGPSRDMCHLFFSRAQDKKRKNYVRGNRLWILGMVWQLRNILLIASYVFDPISSVQRI